MIVSGSDIIGDLLRRLGITRPVREATIRLPLDGLVTVEVEYLMEKDQAEALVETFALLRAEPLKVPVAPVDASKLKCKTCGAPATRLAWSTAFGLSSHPCCDEHAPVQFQG